MLARASSRAIILIHDFEIPAYRAELAITASCSQIVEHPCEACDGVGRVVESREIDVEIPAGIHDGQRIRVSGHGHAGALGGRAGDVYVLVRVKPDPRFVREGNDIYSQVDLTIVEAALGATMTVETIDGAIELELPAGVQPGEVRVLRGKGMPVLQGFGRGDHRVLVNVSVPRHVVRRAAPPAGGLRGGERRAHLSPRRELLREAEERVPLTGLRRVAVEVGAARLEEARATMLELFPAGFEEVDRPGGSIELAAYTDAAGEERLWHFFGGVHAADVEAGWEDRWRAFHRPVTVGALWVGPPWETPPGGTLAVVVDPGRAFGTGSHPTTQLCLRFLQEPRARVAARRRLRLGCALDRRGAARVRAGRRRRHRGAVDRGDARERPRERRRGARPASSRPTSRCRRPRSRSPTSRSTRCRRCPAASTPQTLVTSGYFASEQPELAGYRHVDRSALEGWASDVYVRA